jgi:prepilin-type N-terminal cleavage/methylation domain-containing protein
MKRGLTLIEVLLAVAILGFGFVVLLTAATRCLAVFKAARNYQEAQWTLGIGEAEHPLQIKDDIEDLKVDPETYGNGFTFSREVEEEDESEVESDNLHVVRTRVTWGGSGESAHVEEVVRYVYFEKK